jgi:hypothetical protein
MPSTSAVTSPPIAGVTTLPGLQVSPYGAALTNLKVYDISITTSSWSTGSTAFYPANYSVSGLTTNDIPIALIPSTANWAVPLVGLSPGLTANNFNVLWGGNSTTATAVGIANKMGATLVTLSYYTQSSSTST